MKNHKLIKKFQLTTYDFLPTPPLSFAYCN